MRASAAHNQARIKGVPRGSHQQAARRHGAGDCAHASNTQWPFPVNLQAAASAADLQNLRNIDINSWFFEFSGSRDHANLVQIEFSPKLPQEFRQIVRYCPETESQTFWKFHFQHFCQKLNFYRGFTGNRLRQNDRNDRGIISIFYEKCDFDRRFAGQSPRFPENLYFHFLCLNKWFLSGRQIREEFICLEYKI